MAALLLGVFMAAMEMTVVSTVMPTVVGDLGGIHLYSWVFAAYMLTSTVTMPIYGKLADLYGRKPIILVGIFFFLAGSTASGQSQSMGQLIAFRALQGLGAGAMQPVALTIIGDLFKLEERARVQGLFGGMWGLAGLTGPILGASILRVASWRWVFYLNIPFGLASALVLLSAYHERVETRQRNLDFGGAALLAGSIIAMLVASRGGAMLLGLPLAAGLLIAFVAVERRAPEPVVSIALMKQPVMAVASSAGGLVGATMIATVTFVPLYVQGVLGGSPGDAARAMTPMVVGWPIASYVAGRIVTRVGFRPLIRLGLLVSTVAAGLIAVFLHPGIPLWVPSAITCLFGVGLGLTNTSLLLAVQTSVEWEERGIATASTLFFRTIGGALAVGFLGSILAAALRRDPTVPASAADQLMGPEHGRGLAPELIRLLSAALESGLGTIFWCVVGISVTALLLSAFFPSIDKSEPGIVAGEPTGEGAVI